MRQTGRRQGYGRDGAGDLRCRYHRDRAIGLTPQSSAKLGAMASRRAPPSTRSVLLKMLQRCKKGRGDDRAGNGPDRVAEAISLRLASRPSASALVADATARCLSLTICLGCSTASHHASLSATRNCSRKWSVRWSPIARKSLTHRFPAAEHVFSMDESAWTEWQQMLSRDTATERAARGM